MICTRMDIARRLGGLLSAAQKADMSFCDTSFTPKVTDGITQMTPQRLSTFLVNPDRALRAILTPNEAQDIINQKTAGRA
ncbi:MAG: hypothetical protein COB76_06795 [Alphaproteobacteria bacterium]|nr:MAG: hypothetical protein COB76_06795 [Alphaproteobacteria bacterium]